MFSIRFIPKPPVGCFGFLFNKTHIGQRTSHPLTVNESVKKNSEKNTIPSLKMVS